MFRLSLLIATLMAASLNAANVRYELINEPAKQDGKELSGHITVETSGSAVPARGFIGNEHILDWHIECDGQTISMATANRETKGVSMLNQGYGNFLVATTDGLYEISVLKDSLYGLGRYLPSSVTLSSGSKRYLSSRYSVVSSITSSENT